MLHSSKLLTRLPTLPNILPGNGRVHQLSHWLASGLVRFWSAQCRCAERPNRVVPRY